MFPLSCSCWLDLGHWPPSDQGENRTFGARIKKRVSLQSLILDTCIEPDEGWQNLNSIRCDFPFQRVKCCLVVDETTLKTCTISFAIILQSEFWQFCNFGATLQVRAPRKVLSSAIEPTQTKLVEFSTLLPSIVTSSLLTRRLCLFFQLQEARPWGSVWLLLQLYEAISRVPSMPQQRAALGNFSINISLFSFTLRVSHLW